MTDAAAISSCTLTTDARITAVAVCERRTVCYEFDTHASGKPDLDIPYLVIVDGKVQNQGKPRRLERNRKITLAVEANSTVALYLNSDVHPAHRRNPVYAVHVGIHDILIKIKEQLGNKESVEAVVGEATTHPPTRPGGRPIDYYTAKMTGDVWMLISHRYTSAEAEALLPVNIDRNIRDAVCSIYRVLPDPKLDIPHLDDSGHTHVSFIDQAHPQAHIRRCSLLRDVLPRTHPCAFAALFEEARSAGLAQMHVTSCWRPLMGSMAHRSGLGLDIVLIADSSEVVRINRTGLINDGPSRNPYVSDEEKARFREFRSSEEVAKKNPKDKNAAADVETKRTAWEKAMRSRQPALIEKVRTGLNRQPLVKQILDPWYIEFDTHKPDGCQPNQQKRGDEKLHKDHMHITMEGSLIYG
jgi:hypothetical protein